MRAIPPLNPALGGPLRAALTAILVIAGLAASASAQVPNPPARRHVAARPASPAAPPAPVIPPRPGARLAPGQPIPVPELEAFIDGAVQDARAADHIAGATVAVVQNGQVVLLKGYGFAHLDPSTPVDPLATLFRLGSISKTFTWITVLKAVETGRMKLDAPVNTYLPEGLRLPDGGFDKPVLVRQLMSHSAGFEAREFGRLMVDRPEEVRSLSAYLQRNRPRRVRDPGELSSYSNYGAALAGAAVATADGQSFETLVERQVLAPLGMQHTSFREPYPEAEGLPAPMDPGLAQGLSSGFRWTGTAYETRPFEYVSQLAPAGSASATAMDMARYMTALLNGGQVGETAVWGPATAKALQTTLQANAPGLNGWAHGFMEYSLPGPFQAFGHDGDTLSFNANMTTVPELGLGIFVAANTSTGARLTQRLAGDVVGRFYAGRRDAPRLGAQNLASRRADYEGLYLTTRRAQGGLEKFIGRLTSLSAVRVGDDGRLTIVHAGRGRSFVPDGVPGRFVAAEGEDRIAFAPVQGQAQMLFTPGSLSAGERVGWLYHPIVLGVSGGLALAGSLAVFAGLALRGSRERQARSQVAASRTQAIGAGLWIVAAIAFTIWLLLSADPAQLVFHWPSPWLLAASWLALAAAVLSLFMAFQLPGVWRGERRVAGWTGWRKLRHTITVLVYLVFGVLLAGWGALQPWTG